MGILYGVGVGPGDPEYMTLKAVRVIKESDILLLPNRRKEDCYAYQIVKNAIPDIEDKQVVCFEFPMIKDTQQLENIHDAIYGQINEYLQNGMQVAFLTIGDPSVYSTYHYIHRRVTQNGGKAKMISGVPSFCAAAAELGIALGERREAIHILPGNYPSEFSSFESENRIYMKSGKKLRTLISDLEEESKKKDIKVWAVSNCGFPNEKIYANLDELKGERQYDYLTIVIVKSL